MSVLLETDWILFTGIGLLALFGYKFNALSISGAFGTIIIGIAIAKGFEGYGLLVIGAFFISSSFWSKYKRKIKTNVEDRVEKGSRRDIIQVFANGIVPAFFSIANIMVPSEIWVYGFVTAIAVANSDTWASEIGTLSKQKPISILNWQRVERGTSGAVSVLGTGAAILGAAFIAIWSAFIWDEITLVNAIAITLLGTVGCFIDTILGAGIQASFRCKKCGEVVEKRSHCQNQTTLIKGYAWVNNDIVNVSAIVIASAISLLLTN